MASVTLTHVKKVYPGKVTAVHDACLEIHDKEFMVVVGPSGCGKTTTLRMVAGLEEITDGTVRIGERVVNDVLPKDRDIAMVFQNYAIYPHMTVYENMAFGLRQRGFPKAEIDQRVRNAARVLEIESFLDRRPKALSGGQRQRVALGRAIVREPAVFLFDEPLSNLDAKMRVDMRKELKLLHQRLQTTMIYVTHDQVEAMTLGHRICVMRDGWIEQVGRPLDVYDNPRTRFVASFIGTPPMNFISGVLRKKGRAPFFSTESFDYELPDRFLAVLPEWEGKGLEMGIRPEYLAHQEQAAAGRFISATVQIVEALGNEQLVYLKTGRFALVSRCDAHIRANPAEEQLLVAKPEKIHLFDIATGHNLTQCPMM
jgi:multiple sugar transport system ATP-binding protein